MPLRSGRSPDNEAPTLLHLRSPAASPSGVARCFLSAQVDYPANPRAPLVRRGGMECGCTKGEPHPVKISLGIYGSRPSDSAGAPPDRLATPWPVAAQGRSEKVENNAALAVPLSLPLTGGPPPLHVPGISGLVRGNRSGAAATVWRPAHLRDGLTRPSPTRYLSLLE